MSRQLIFLALLAILTGCGGHPTKTHTPTPPLIDQLDPLVNGWPTSLPNPLGGTYWNLLSFNGQPLIPGTRIILSFSNRNLNGGIGDTVYGNAGCNDYNGPFYISGQQIRLGIVQMYVVGCTQMGWMSQQNQAWMEQEDTYYHTFTAVMGNRIADYQVSSDGSRTLLDILDADHQPVLEYEKIDLDRYQYLSANLLLFTPTPK